MYVPKTRVRHVYCALLVKCWKGDVHYLFASVVVPTNMVEADEES